MIRNDLDYFKVLFADKLKNQGECAIFCGSKNKKGYGQFNNPYEKAAHRFAWYIHHGPIPKGLMVLHKCDIPACCEISHLWIGTAADNTKDMISKGRQWNYNTMPKGEKCASSKITEQKAKDIIKLLEKRTPFLEISLALEISLHIIYGISCRKTWRHLEFNKPEPLNHSKNCLICGLLFFRKPFEIEKSKYCSYACYWKWMQDKNTEKLKNKQINP